MNFQRLWVLLESKSIVKQKSPLQNVCPLTFFCSHLFFFFLWRFTSSLSPKNTKGNEENQQNEMNITQKNGVRVTTLNRVC
jgi:hypothetical protein